MAHLRPLSQEAIARCPIGLRLRELRMEAGISQRELGIRIGIDPDVASARVNQYERGKNEPAFAVMRLLARELKVPTAYFYTEDDALARVIRAFVP